MKKFLAICFLVVLIGCKNSMPPTGTGQQRLIHNNDGTEILGNNWFDKRPLTIDDVNQYVDMIANSQVTTFMICSGSDFFYYRSKYGRFLGDDKNGTLNCGDNAALYDILSRLYQNAMVLDKQGTDIVEASLKRAREKKLETFVSFRMNDLHFSDTSKHCTVQYSDFWIAHPEYWTSDTTLKGWNSWNALDFAHPEVRSHKLNVIREQLEKFGPLTDGYEMDFMRFIVYFKKAEAEKNAPLMTDLVKAAREIADSVGKANNKKILLTARVPANIDDCIRKGLDVREWVKLGLVDFLTLGVHWRGEPSMPVADFKNKIGHEIPVYATIDDGGYDPREVYSHGMYRGMASHMMAQGAAGPYLFNYFLTAYNEAGHKLIPEKGTFACRTIAPELLHELGSLETLKKRNKIYCLSDGATSYELTPTSPLPLALQDSANAGIFVGDDVQADQPEEIILFIRTNTKDSFTVSINGQNLQPADTGYPALFDREKGLKPEQRVVAFSVPVSQIKKGENLFQFSGGKQGLVLQRLELALKYGPVETAGFF